MTRRTTVQHQFTEIISDTPQDGVVYISIKYATAIHLCCCGCRTEVITPLSPAGWSLTFDGQSISLSPSIGNWSFPCQSHYWIKHNKIQWARRWNQEEIAGARRQRAAEDRPPPQDGQEPAVPSPQLARRIRYFMPWRRRQP
jgi:hypothetical protein